MSDSSPDRLSRIPTLTPSSPKRRPLAQRSDSERNSASTIRLVGEDEKEEPSSVYAKSPFPSHPTHHLPPGVSKLPPQRYAPFVDKDVLVSDENTPTNRSTIKTTQYDAPALKPLQLRRSNRGSTSTSISDADTSIITTSSLTTNDTFLSGPSSSRQSSRTTPPSSPITEAYYEDHFSRLEPVDEESALESPKSKSVARPTIRAVAPSASTERLPLNAKASGASLATTASSLSLPAHAHDYDGAPSPASSGNFQVYDHSSSQVSLTAGQERDLEPSPAPSIHSKPIHNYASLESLLLEESSRPATAKSYRPRSASSPKRPSSYASDSTTHPVQTATAVRIQYPVVRPPSTSGSWAEVPSPATSSKTPTPRMQNDPYRPPQWSSRLSTIASESERSNSYSTSTENGSRGKRRRTIGSFTSNGASTFSDPRSSEWEYGSGVLTGTESNISIPIPQPLFSPRPLPAVPDERYTQGRDSDERDDIVGELQAPYLRPQRSGILTRFSSKSSLRPSSSSSTRSQGSQISFVGELMWARRYYSTGEPVNMMNRNGSFVSESSGTARLNTATSGVTSSPISDTVPSNIWRPRNRPRDAVGQTARRLRQETRRIYRPQQRRSSEAISEEGTEASEGRRSHRLRSLSTPELSVREMRYSPHLRRDRRQTQRYSTWAAPSFDEPLSRTVFSPINRQIFCFALGFILPMAWWVAAFLPLPQRPDPENAPATTTPRASGLPPSSANPSEFSLQEKRWQKAQWWRRVNRILGVFGLVLVGTIIALAVIGTRGNGFNSGPSRTPITVSTSS